MKYVNKYINKYMNKWELNLENGNSLNELINASIK